MQNPQEIDEGNERVTITLDDCLYETEPSDLEIHPHDFYKKFYKEFGYRPTRPTILSASLGSLRRIDLADLDQNVQISTSGPRTINPVLQRHFRFDPHARDNSGHFFHRNAISLVLHDSARWSPDEDCQRHFWLTWLRRGASRKEMFLKVGLSACQVHVFLREGECRFLWWERETQALPDDILWDWFDPLCDRLQTLSYGDAPSCVAGAWSEFLREAIEPVLRIDSLAEDTEMHLYQNPEWEHIFFNNGSVKRAERILEQNCHPRSGYWVAKSGEYMALEVG